jgi:hypothetical protein
MEAPIDVERLPGDQAGSIHTQQPYRWYTVLHKTVSTSTIGRMPITRRSPEKTLPRPDGKVVSAWSIFGQFFVRKVLA